MSDFSQEQRLPVMLDAVSTLHGAVFHIEFEAQERIFSPVGAEIPFKQDSM